MPPYFRLCESWKPRPLCAELTTVAQSEKYDLCRSSLAGPCSTQHVLHTVQSAAADATLDRTPTGAARHHHSQHNNPIQRASGRAR
eukprot:4730325-Karenia_brevis.AAC.1